MSALREAAQQALEALEEYAPQHGRPDDMMVAITALRAALAQEQAEPDTCTWQQDGYVESSTYRTSCGHYFNLENGTPADNKMAHCCYCGKKLVQELITENKNG